MATSRQFFLFFILFIFLNKSKGEVIVTCPVACRGNGPTVRFPFRLTEQSNRCGYPAFELSCNYRRQTILRLNNSGEFTVQSIDYASQIIEINDPDYCLPRRFLNPSFSLVGPPFDEQIPSEFMFLNCSGTVRTLTVLRYVPCLSGTNFTVVAIPMDRYREFLPLLKPSCLEISTARIPVPWPVWSSLAEGVKLKWYVPDCSLCEGRGGLCGFKNDKKMDMEIGCTNDPEGSTGLPRSVKYGIIISIGIPGFLCFIGLGCYLCGKVNNCLQRHHSGTDFATSITPQPASVLNGLDRPTIESYPKTLIGESGRLPKPNDNTCPICLSEYQPKETLRTIPECNHYFHANCIDEWLKINGTCPLCRKFQGSSRVLTPSTSTSSSSSSLMSTP